VGNILARLQKATSWGGSGGTSHQFLQKGITYSSSKLSGGGSGYVFWRYGSYDGYANNSVTKPASQPYGVGVGYFTNNAKLPLYITALSTSTGYWAYQVSDGAGPVASSTSNKTIPAFTSASFWSCKSATDPTPYGQITYLVVSDGAPNTSYQLTSIDVTGLTGLGTFTFSGHKNLKSIDVSKCIVLQKLSFWQTGITGPLDVSHNPALTFLTCSWGPAPYITSLDLSNNPLLNHLDCSRHKIANLDLSHCPNLTYLCCPTDYIQATVNITGTPLPHDPDQVSFITHSANIPSPIEPIVIGP
jgi:hypothetical protein